ncbi:MAG: cache domain-containing protein [Thermacetogeniaceae bacterium]
MRSLKAQFTLLVTASIIILTLSLMFAFYLQTKHTALMAAETKAKGDLATAEAIIDLKYPGPWHVEDGVLYKGKTKINNNFYIVDYISKLTGDSCTIFLNNIRVTTTVREKNGRRAVGTQASPEVTNKVLGARQEYIGEAVVVGNIYQTAYKPIVDENNKVIGMLYVGAPKNFYNTILYGSLKTMAIVAFFCALFIGVGTWLFITRKVVAPLHEVIQGTRDAATNRGGYPLVSHGSTEIWELTQAVNQMLARFQSLAEKLPTESSSVSQQGEDTLSQLASEEEWPDALLCGNEELPKGLNRVTLREVILYVKQKEGEEFTIQDVSRDLSLSKVTVRRYLDYLEQRGIVEVEQRYGSVGRPLRIYRLKQKYTQQSSA